MKRNLSFTLRTDYKHVDTNEYPIFFRVSQDNKRRLKSTGISVKKISWDPRKRKVRSSDIHYKSKNNTLDFILSQAKQIHFDTIVNGISLSPSAFIEKMDEIYSQNRSFSDFAYQIKKEKSPELGSATLKNYDHQINKILGFRNNFAITDIDLSFIRAYKAHLKGTLKNNENTATKSLSFLRMMCLEAKKANFLTVSPFEQFKLERVTAKEDYLTHEELNKLEKLYEANSLPKSTQKVLKQFLFACYTGVAHGDLTNLMHKNIEVIQKNDQTHYLLVANRQKTGNRFRVPLSEKALKLIDKKFSEHLPSLPLFRVISNQPYNRHLKAIGTKLKLNKNITSHLARHTFGTHMVSAGVHPNLIMEMMGQKDIKVHQVYAKIEDSALINSMFSINPEKIMQP